MTHRDPASPASNSSAPDLSAPAHPRDKLPPERIAELREWVEGSTVPFKRIGAALGVSASTLSRYAAQGGWRRPPGAAAAARLVRPNPEPERRRKAPRPVTGERRQELTEKLWRLAERHAEELEDQPIAVAGRALQPLARLTRTLGEMDKHARPCPQGNTRSTASPAAASTSCAMNSRPIWSASSVRRRSMTSAIGGRLRMGRGFEEENSKIREVLSAYLSTSSSGATFNPEPILTSSVLRKTKLSCDELAPRAR